MERNKYVAPVSSSDDARSDEKRAGRDRNDAARQAEQTLGQRGPRDDDLETRSHELAREYLRLGGRRRAVMDDNLTDTRKWEPDEPEADDFWRQNVAALPANERKQVEDHLPSVNED